MQLFGVLCLEGGGGIPVKILGEEPPPVGAMGTLGERSWKKICGGTSWDADGCCNRYGLRRVSTPTKWLGWKRIDKVSDGIHTSD